MAKRAFIIVLLTVAGIFGVRTWRFHRLSPDLSPEEWWIRDELETNPNTLRKMRIASFGSAGSARNIRLVEALDKFHEATGLPLIVRWDAMASAGISKDTPCSIQMTNATVPKLLNTILSDADGGKVLLAWRYRAGAIVVSTYDDFQSDCVVRVYPVKDLIEFYLAHPAPTSIIDGWVARGTVDPDVQVADTLIRLVRETVDVNSWRENGGRCAAIRYLDGKLTVIAEREDQVLIHEILRELREMRSYK